MTAIYPHSDYAILMCENVKDFFLSYFIINATILFRMGMIRPGMFRPYIIIQITLSK